MKDVTHISFEGGGLIIPVHTPYALQTLFEHLELSTTNKRHRFVRLGINRGDSPATGRIVAG